MKKSLPLVTIAIITYNATKTLRQCLDSVFKLDYPRNKYEVLIVDAGSNDGTLDIVKEFSVDKVVVEDGCTRGRGRNICINEARGEIVAMVDADKILTKKWLRNVVNYFEDPQLAFVAGSISTLKTPMPKDLSKIDTIVYFFSCGPLRVSSLED